MKLTFLGTGTSHGIPVIACDCPVCHSTDPHDKRYRSSAHIETNDGLHIQIDVGPEFRLQAIEHKIKQIDTVLLTHAHADHVFGIDDLRIFSCDFKNKPADENSRKILAAPPIPIYTNKTCINDVKTRFNYIFAPVKEGGGHAKIDLQEATKPFFLGKTEIVPIPMMHGYLETTGWLLVEKNPQGEKQSLAYLTDCNFMSQDSINLIKNKCGNLKHLIIDGLRVREHSTHFNFLQAMEVCQQIGGEHIWFIHMTHNESHEQIKEYIKAHLGEFPGLARAKSVLPSYDGLILEM